MRLYLHLQINSKKRNTAETATPTREGQQFDVKFLAQIAIIDNADLMRQKGSSWIIA